MPYEYTVTATTRALWRFNSSLADASANGYTLTAHNPSTLTYVKGVLNNAVVSDEAGIHYFYRTDSCGLALGAFTMSQWFLLPADMSGTDHLRLMAFRNEPAALYYAYIELTETAGTDSYQLAGSRSYNVLPDKTVAGGEVLHNLTISPQVWHHVAFSWDGVSRYRLYFDGVCVGSSLEADAGTYDYSGLNVGMDLNAFATDQPKDCWLDETILDGREWTPEEVVLYYDNHNTMFSAVMIPGV